MLVWFVPRLDSVPQEAFPGRPEIHVDGGHRIGPS